MDIRSLSKAEFLQYNINLVVKLLIEQGYEINKATQTRSRTDFTVSSDNESFNIKISGYRYNQNTNGNYAFIRKSYCDLDKFKYLFFVLCIDNKAYTLKIPSRVFRNPPPNSPFKNRDYPGLKSLPEYGIMMNKNNLNELLCYEEK